MVVGFTSSFIAIRVDRVRANALTREIMSVLCILGWVRYQMKRMETVFACDWEPDGRPLFWVEKKRLGAAFGFVWL